MRAAAGGHLGRARDGDAAKSDPKDAEIARLTAERDALHRRLSVYHAMVEDAAEYAQKAVAALAAADAPPGTPQERGALRANDEEGARG